MNDYNEEKEKKGGFLSGLSGIFRGGSSAIGGSSSGMGSAGGLGGLFATKAGIVGMVLGGATIAAGVGVVYNFIGPSSKPAYSPELFQNSYYEEESSKAGAERARARDASAADSSTLDMFKEQAKKDGIGGLASEGGDADKSDKQDDSAANAGASADAAAPGAPSGAAAAEGAAGGGPKLQAASGFGGKGGAGGGGGASSSVMPKMSGNGGLSGGIGGQFASVYKAPANSGKLSGMTASAARVSNSPKYAVPNFNKKGAYGQAKYAGKMGAKAAYSSDGAGARTGATQAFTGETAGTGDVAAGGTGLGGAGVSGGDKLKANDPSLSSNESKVPKVADPTEDNPYKKYEDMAMYGMLAGAVLLMLAKYLAGLAAKARDAMLAATPFSAPLVAAYMAARMHLMLACYAAMAAGAAVLFAGFKMFSEFGQKMEGGLYMAAGGMIIWKAYEAMSEFSEANLSQDGKSISMGDKAFEPGGKAGVNIKVK